ncbi:LacI family DNA-binding transcriptional regulator [Pedobacter sp.]|uniref:LacI family DNA-binding transcriptional regulator n=1 Tax=Pedobacter sp. TaxID=1411316 RepID=UPI003D7F7852
MFSKPTTLKEIAARLNISISTVSRALHDHPSIGLTMRQKVRKVATEMNYEPNQSAVFFQKGKTHTIGVILPELSEAFFSSATSAIEETAYKKNYTVLLAQSHDSEQKERELVDKMKKHRVDGLLVSLAKNTSSFEHFERLKDYDIPVVFFDRIPPLQNIHSVACNMETGTIEAVNYLLKKGHRTIGMINGPKTLFASNERKQGYIEAMKKNRLKFDPSLIVNCDLTEENTEECLTELLGNKRKVTAIVTFNDYVALFAIKKTRLLQLSGNNTLEFVSFANLPLINYMDHVPVASVEQFPREQGQRATDILFELLAQKERSPEKPPAFYNFIIESKLVENNRPTFE